MVNEGVRRAFTHPDNVLRGSVLADPDGSRTNTRDNTPAVIHTRVVPGDRVAVEVAAKGGGSEAKAMFRMLNPSDSVADWIVEVVPKMGAGWCPPGILGVGIGGTPEKAMLLAKESMMAPIDIHALRERGASNRAEELRLELFDRVNALGIGAQGLGGLTTVLDVKVREYPTHAVNKPVAVIPNCTATRHIGFELDGNGPATFTPPDLDDWPDIAFEMGDDVRRVNLDRLDREDIATWKAGETLLLSGKLLTGRDAAHRRLTDMIAAGESLPVDFNGRFIYYVGPVDPVRDEVVGPAGPTTATRMDKFTRVMLERTGLLGMVGKAERGAEAIELTLDYETGRASYRSTSPGSGGQVGKWHVQPALKRFLTPEFLSLFIFDGEFAGRLLDGGQAEADRVVDALCQVYLLREASVVAEEFWKQQSKADSTKTGKGLEARREERDRLAEREKMVWERLARAKVEIAEIGAEVAGLEAKISERMDGVEETRRLREEAAGRRAEAQGDVAERRAHLMNSLRLPYALHPALAKRLTGLRDSLDRVRLPENTSAQRVYTLQSSVVSRAAIWLPELGRPALAALRWRRRRRTLEETGASGRWSSSGTIGNTSKTSGSTEWGSGKQRRYSATRWR